MKTGRRFGFRVLTDAKRYAVHLGSLHTRRSGKLLILRAPGPGPLRAARRRARARGEGDRDGDAVTAHVGGVVASLGLALLLVAPSRLQRLAGLGAWALGAILLAVYLAPHGHRPLLGGLAVVGLVLAAAGAFVLRRWPYVLPFAVLACIAARIHVHVGSTEANLLVPMYAVVAAAALLLAWELLQGDTRAARARPGRLAARGVRRLVGASRSSGRRTCARARSTCSSSTCPSGCWRSCSRGSPGAG